MARKTLTKDFNPTTIATILRNAADLFTEPLILIDRTRRIILANNAAQKLTALEETNLIGQQIESLLSLHDPITNQPLSTLTLPPNELLILPAKIHALPHTATFLPLNYVPYFAAFKPRPIALAIITPQTHGQIATPSTDSIYHTLLGQLTMRVAHDFGNSLTSIIGNAGLIQERLSTISQPSNTEPLATSIEQTLEEIEDIVRKSREMAQLIHTLQEYARQPPTTAHTLDLNAAISDTMTMARSLLGRKIQIEFLPSEDLSKIYMDRLRIDQILLSILVNSKNQMTAGGRITIETEETIINSRFVADHAGAREGNYARLTITDTSPGMDQASLKNLFELRRTSKTNQTSLTLPTVYSILKQFRGYINVESWKGKGTRFDIYLPQTPPTITAPQFIDNEEVLFLHLLPPPPQNLLNEPAQAPANGSLILVAEDDTSVQRFLQKQLGRAGYETIITADGSAALDIYQTLTSEQNQPALLIADLGLPGIDGRSLCNTIKQQYPSASVLLTSGYRIELDNTSRKTKEDGYDFLQKPFAPSALLSTIKKILSKDIP